MNDRRVSDASGGACARAVVEGLEGRRMLAAPPGALDTTFGQGGVVGFPGQRAAEIQTVAGVSLPGGKTLLLGEATFSLPDPHPVLARLNADGTPDDTFGDHGVLIVRGSKQHPIPAMFGRTAALAVDGKGRIYLGVNDTEVYRLTSDGAVDPAFGTDGHAFSGIEIEAMTLAGNGSVLVAGYTLDASSADDVNHDLAVARLTPSGQLDQHFGRNGVASVPFGLRGRHLNSAAHALLVQDDGRILVGGGEDGFFDLVRVKADGSPDTSFGRGGTVRFAGSGLRDSTGAFFNPSPGSPWFASLAVRPSDGAIFAGGGYAQENTYTSNNSAADRPMMVASVTKDGQPNAAFGQAGVVTSLVGPADGGAMATGVTPLADGKVLVTGFGWRVLSSTGPSVGVLMTRLNADGTGDATFGTSLPRAPGPISQLRADLRVRVLTMRAPTQWSGELSWSRFTSPPLVGKDGGFIVPLNGGGVFSVYDELTALRFKADGSLDRTYGRNGVGVATLVEGDPTAVTSVVTGADGSTYVAVRGSLQTTVSRVMADGAVDPAFDGMDVGALSSVDPTLLGVDATGKLLVGEAQPVPSAVPGGPFELALVVRYDANGAPDATFGSGGRVPLTLPAGVVTDGTPSVRKLVFRPDGSMVVDVHQHAGSEVAVEDSDTLVAINAAGRVTGTYSVPTTSVAFFGHGNTTSNYADFTVTPTGDVVLAMNDPTAGASLLKLDGTNLSPVAGFGSGGSVAVPVGVVGQPSGTLTLAAILARADGRLLVEAQAAGTPWLVQFTSGGAVDGSFGQGGAVALPADASVSAGGLLLQQDGKLLYAATDSRRVHRVRRLNADGSVDASFGDGGAVRVPGVLATDPVVLALQETAGGGERLVVAGDTGANQRLLHDAHDDLTVGVVAGVQL